MNQTIYNAIDWAANWRIIAVIIITIIGLAAHTVLAILTGDDR